ncbi:class I SAM-dependent methyltransferase [Paenibacillus fonticola]|uniref:class I SAM-dependent methyltransferase n=1 Tax=Paenibacillus fonticola TaxID=379896 RepID=UPI000377DD0C|nr:class I SAM-dependent methyltransferase [Paenibacillus fonticola]
MSNHDQVYLSQAEAYESMISRQPDLSEIVRQIRPYKNLDVLDLGAGSGRLASFLAPEVKTLICTDASQPMLDILDRKLTEQNFVRNWITLEADHRSLPVPDSSVDLVVSGWSICYLASSNHQEWDSNLDKILSELERILKPDGTIIIFETMGTGTETPDPPEFLTSYYSLLEQKYGFQHRWVRADYKFASVEEAIEHTEFFFGEELAERIKNNRWSTLPECAGVWWKE